MGKRAFDLVVAGLGLVVLAPLMAVIALAIRLDSPGPAIFRQERVGLGGATFLIHKFRTMRAGAAGGLVTVGADARITRVGAFLRRTKLDEIPQLYDVLRGAMSLVGPRPEVPAYVALYPAALKDKVLSVRPGLTDPASIEFRDESERLARASDPEHEYVHVVMPRKLALQAEYIERATLWSDLRLILRTVAAVWGRTG